MKVPKTKSDGKESKCFCLCSSSCSSQHVFMIQQQHEPYTWRWMMPLPWTRPIVLHLRLIQLLKKNSASAINIVMTQLLSMIWFATFSDKLVMVSPNLYHNHLGFAFIYVNIVWQPFGSSFFSFYFNVSYIDFVF